MLEREKKVYDELERLNISYTKVEHESAFTMDDCAAVGEKLGVELCKNLFLCNRQKTVFYLLLIKGEKRFSTKEFSQALGISRVSFAEDCDLLRLLNIEPGAVSVMGIMNDVNAEVNVVLDKDVFDGEFIGCHPCVNTASLKIKTSDVTEKFLPEYNHTFKVIEI